MSKHIKYKKHDRPGMFNAYYEAIQSYCGASNKKINEIRVLDLACGRGEFLEFACIRGIDIEGCDFDEQCLEMSAEFGKVFLFDIEKDTLKSKYDIILMSHVLEHLRCPSEFLQRIRLNCEAIIIGVPNPCRPNVVFNFCLKQQHYCNRGHYYSWDRSHFQNFLDLNRFDVVSWHYDGFHLPGFRIIKIFRMIGLGRIEYKLRNSFPHWSTSHTVLVRS